MKKFLTFTLALVGCVAILAGCKDKTTTKPVATTPTTTTQEQLKYYDFIIYATDSDNDDLTNNTVVVSYHIGYYASTAKKVTDTLIKDGNKYYFTQGGTDYLILEDSGYGLSYTKGYFKDYNECADNTEIDVSWSYTAVNGSMASKGIGETTLTGLNEYGFVINGWA